MPTPEPDPRLQRQPLNSIYLSALHSQFADQDSVARVINIDRVSTMPLSGSLPFFAFAWRTLQYWPNRLSFFTTDILLR